MVVKIQSEHLLRQAWIYIRQSSSHQVYNHLESQRLQYQLVDRAQELGWRDPVVVDDDLGRSGSGLTDRPGFSRLLTSVCDGIVGVIFCLEASRLARNNREWYKLIDCCAAMNTLLIDLDGIYDPCNISDRVFLGMKGTMSEYELAIFRQRARAAILEKAKRGELYIGTCVGYIYTDAKRYELDPDQGVQKMIHMIFKKFRELGTVNQVVLWFRREGIEIPYRPGNRRNSQIQWKLPTRSSISKILRNPFYAGAYAFGQRETRIVIVDGKPIKKKGHELPIAQWQVLIHNHHPAYISWEEFLTNRKRLPENRSHYHTSNTGAPKHGSALLVGRLRCQKCGRKFHVRYKSKKSDTHRYVCLGQQSCGRMGRCVSFSASRVEKLIESEILRVIEPAAIAAAEEAERQYQQQQQEKEKTVVTALGRAEYEANRCFEQYNLSDPKNRFAAQALEERWNQALQQVNQLQQQLAVIRQTYQPLSIEQRQAIYRLADDLPQVWHHPKADMKIKKRILQTLITEIVVDISSDHFLVISIHWAGGKHTQYRIKRQQPGERHNHSHPETETIIRGLAEVTPDKEIARILNLLKITTTSGKTWIESRVAGFRRKHHIAAFNPKQYAEKGLINLSQAAELLDLNPTTLSRLIKAKIIKARQVVKYGPWIIDKEHLTETHILKVVASLKNGAKIPFTQDPNQLTIN